MYIFYRSLFEHPPVTEKNGIYLFGKESDGDCFDKSDALLWKEESFARNLQSSFFLDNPASRKLIDHIIERNTPVVELACGPGMGLIPSIKMLSPDLHCLATDASPLVIQSWRDYIAEASALHNLDFAQFSIMDIPFTSNSIPCYSSYIGVSSTRNGYEGFDKALSEIHRTLSPGGYFYTIESELTDIDTIFRLFKKMRKEPWKSIKEASTQPSWQERFERTGFKIASEENFGYRLFTKDDNELGEVAEKHGIEIGTKLTAFILKK